MAQIDRWQPLRELAVIHDDTERLWSRLLGRQLPPAELSGTWSPAMDVEENDAAFVVQVEVPGIEPSDIEITLDEDVLAISGDRKFYAEKSEDGFRRIERKFGRFYRTLRLPTQVAADKIQARHADGMVVITIPKEEAKQSRTIPVETS